MPVDSLDNTPRLQTLSREAFWQRHVAQWQSSGLSKMAYCQQYALTYHQMVYWSKKQEHSLDSETTSDGFVALNICPDATDGALSIRLPNGLTIQGINDRSVGLVGKLIAQL